jgi:hypothetical protein
LHDMIPFDDQMGRKDCWRFMTSGVAPEAVRKRCP